MRNKLKRLGRRLAFKGEIVDLYKDTVQLPDGKIQEWDYVHHKKGGGACIVPVLPDGRILMIRQYRPAIDEATLELPAGAKDMPDEDTALTAMRELREETGFTCKQVQFLCRLRTAVAYCNEITDVYLADGVIREGEQSLDEAEDIYIEALPLPELMEMIADGRLTDAKTVAGLSAYSSLVHSKHTKRLNSTCLSCQLDAVCKKLPQDLSPGAMDSFAADAKALVRRLSGYRTAPEISYEVAVLRRDRFGPDKDYAEEKQLYNKMLLKMLPKLEEKITGSADPFLTALQLALCGNYIDFAALPEVRQEVLEKLLADSDTITVDLHLLETLRAKVRSADTLCYIADNAGEIVCDRLFIRQMKRENPNLQVTVLVRGEPIQNDATYEDATAVGLNEEALILPNGSGVAGTVLGRISPEAEAVFWDADVRIAKGQGNYETIQENRTDTFFLFLCKCQLFTETFGVEPLTAMLTRK